MRFQLVDKLSCGGAPLSPMSPGRESGPRRILRPDANRFIEVTFVGGCGIPGDRPGSPFWNDNRNGGEF
jgi:hypothetical protein